MQQARTRARHRLIGAAVLVTIGLVVFPMLFENQPRPVAGDVAIEIARRGDDAPGNPPVGRSPPGRNASPSADPTRDVAVGNASQPVSGPVRPPSKIITESAADAGREVPRPPGTVTARNGVAVDPPVAKPPAVKPPEPRPEPKPAAKPPEPRPEPKPAAKTVPRQVAVLTPAAPSLAGAPPRPKAQLMPAPAPAAQQHGGQTPAAASPAPPAQPPDGARAQSLLEGKEVKPDLPVDGPRYVVQVGAFADGAAARDARSRVERLGMKTYTHVANTPAGERTRVRVGPVASRAEADRMQARLKAAGMAAVVLTL